MFCLRYNAHMNCFRISSFGRGICALWCVSIALAVCFVATVGGAFASQSQQIILTPNGILSIGMDSLARRPLIDASGSGEQEIIASFGRGRSMVLLGDGVLVAHDEISFYALPAPSKRDAAEETDNEEASEETPPRWSVSLARASVATDAAVQEVVAFALGAEATADGVASNAAPLRWLRLNAQGVESKTPTNIPADRSVLALARFDGAWIAVIAAPAPSAPLGEGEVRPVGMQKGAYFEAAGRIEVWSSPDGAFWNDVKLPARAARVLYDDPLPSSVSLAMGKPADAADQTVLFLTIEGRLLRAFRDEGNGGLHFREVVCFLDASNDVAKMSFADGRFYAFSSLGAITTTSDGTSWAEQSMPPNCQNQLEGIGVLDGRLSIEYWKPEGGMARGFASELLKPKTTADRTPPPSPRVESDSAVASCAEGVAFVSDGWCWTKRHGEFPKARAWVGLVRSIAVNAEGAWIAGATVQLIPWEGTPDPKPALEYLHARVFTTSRGAIGVVGVPASDPAGNVWLAIRSSPTRENPAANTAASRGGWTEYATNRFNSSTPLAVALGCDMRGDVLYMLEREERWSFVPSNAGDAAGGADAAGAAGTISARSLTRVFPQVRVWQAAIGDAGPARSPVDFQAVGVPVLDRSGHTSPASYALAVGPGQLDGSTRIAFAMNQQVFSRTNEEPWIESIVPDADLAPLNIPTQVFLAIGSEGTIYWQLPGKQVRASGTGRGWSISTIRQPLVFEDVLCVRRAPFRSLGDLASLDVRDLGRVELLTSSVGPDRKPTSEHEGRAIEEVVRNPVTPTIASDPTTASLPAGAKYFSNIVCEGGQWYGASERGFARADDGRFFRPLLDWSMPKTPFGIGTTPGAIWLWSMSPESRGTSRNVLLLPTAANEKPVEITTPIYVDSGCCVDDIAAFVGVKERAPNAPAVLAWTRDRGKTWKELTFPHALFTQASTGGPSLVHGPMGWAFLGQKQGAEPVLLWTNDLEVAMQKDITRPVAGVDGIELRALAVAGSRFAIHGRMPSGAAIPDADFLLVADWDGPWESFAMPRAMFWNGTAWGQSTLSASNGVAILTIGSDSCFSRDLVDWYKLDLWASSTDPQTWTALPQAGLVYASSPPQPNYGVPDASIRLAKLPSIVATRSMPARRFEPRTYRASTSEGALAAATLRWNAAMAIPDTQLTGGIHNRFKVMSEWLVALRKCRPGRPTDASIVLAAEGIARFLNRHMFDNAFDMAVQLTQVMNASTGAKVNTTDSDGLERIAAHLRKTGRTDFADMLEDVDRGRRGKGRRLEMSEAKADSQPRQGAVLFDFEETIARAMRGEAGAMFDLCVAQSNGYGIELDQAGAVFWRSLVEQAGFAVQGPALEIYPKLAEAGSSLAFVQLASLIGTDAEADPRLEPDIARKRQCLRRASELGSFEAMYQLGGSLQYDTGTADDLIEARRFYLRSAAGGFAPAMSALASIYADGTGVARDQALAAGWRDMSQQELQCGLFVRPRRNDPNVDINATRAAARAGDAVACIDLSDAYGFGYGVEANQAFSKWWARRAEALGWDPDKRVDSKSGRQATPFAFAREDRSDAEYLAFLEQGAAAGSLRFMRELGIALEQGRLGVQDSARGRALLERAANAGFSAAWSDLGRANIGDNDIEAAEANFIRAANAGDVAGAILASVVLAGDIDIFFESRAQAMQLLVKAAGADAPKDAAGNIVDPRVQAEAYCVAADRAIAEVAHRTISPRAMTARAFALTITLPHRVAEIDEALVWMHAAVAMEQPLVPLAAIENLSSPEASAAARQKAPLLLWRLERTADAESCDLRLVKRAEQSLRGKSVMERAYGALLAHTLDDALFDEASKSVEVFATGGLESLRDAAGKHPTKRGLELVAAMAGIPDAEIAATLAKPSGEVVLAKAIVARVDGSGAVGGDAGADAAEEIDMMLEIGLSDLVPAMFYYGIGVKHDPKSALELLASFGDRQNAVRTGFILDNG